MKIRDVLRILADDGWLLARTRGSHRQFKHPVKPGLVTVSGHPGQDLSLDIQRSILRQAQLHVRRIK